jgi:predicted site-specific integrase-resolvase
MRSRTNTELPSRLAWQVNVFCRALGISRTSFYELVKQDKIKTIVMAGRRLVPDSEARRLLESGAA